MGIISKKSMPNTHSKANRNINKTNKKHDIVYIVSEFGQVFLYLISKKQIIKQYLNLVNRSYQHITSIVNTDDDKTLFFHNKMGNTVELNVRTGKKISSFRLNESSQLIITRDN